MRHFCYSVIIGFMIIISFALVSDVRADEDMIIDAGVPNPPTLPIADESFKYVDIHARRLAFREESKKFTALIKERQKNYTAPRQYAVDHYAQNRSSVHTTSKTSQ